MKEKYIHKIDVLLESLRSHMNLLIGALKAPDQLEKSGDIPKESKLKAELREELLNLAVEQMSRIERDVKEIKTTLEEGIKEG